jgi:hypothetical protein
MLDAERFSHIKEVYTLVDCLSDLGGFFEVILVLTTALMRPISYHSYILKTLKKLYSAKTKRSDLFKPPSIKLKGVDILQKQVQISELIGFYFRRDLINERVINLRLGDSVFLFFSRYVPFFKYCWKKSDIYLRLFDEG